MLAVPNLARMSSTAAFFSRENLSMFSVITCPACQNKLTVPEGSMGKRQTCPNCQTPFLAGKSVSEEEVAMKLQAAPAAAFNKTMLGETAPPIKFSCPRCKKPLEA